MSAEINALQHDASVVYNHLCSDDADRVYVDREGHLQVDNRWWIVRLFSSLGDSSRKATDMVAIRTLKRVMESLANKTLDPKKIIVQERVPVGMFMGEDEVTDRTVDDLKKVALHPSVPAQSSTRPAPNKKYIDFQTFGMNIGNASRFKTWMKLDFDRKPQEASMTYKQKVCHRVGILTNRILGGPEFWAEFLRDPEYRHFDQDIV